MVAEKESKIAEMDAASSGEAARLRAAMETLKGELGHLKSEHVLTPIIHIDALLSSYMQKPIKWFHFTSLFLHILFIWVKPELVWDYKLLNRIVFNIMLTFNRIQSILWSKDLAFLALT